LDSLSLMLNSMTMGTLVVSRSLPAMRLVTSGSLQSIASRTMGRILPAHSIRSAGAIFRPASGFSSRLRVRSTDLISGRQPNRDQTGETL
jgi:hypothetical protein